MVEELEELEKILGVKVHVWYLENEEGILAYSWHYDEEKSLNHLRKIEEYHGLRGNAVYGEYNTWLAEKLREVLIHGRSFKLPEVSYRNRRVYEEIIKIPRGKTATYSGIARKSGVAYTELLVALLRNPLQILIPCHRLLTKKGTLMGFYPLGKDVKRRLLDMEGAKYGKKDKGQNSP